MAKKLLSTLGFKAEELIREDGYRPTISIAMDLRSDVDLNGTRIIAQFWDGDPELPGTNTIIVQPEMVSPYSFEELRPAEYKSNGVDITGPGNLLYTNSGEAIPGRGDLTDIVGDYTWHRLTLEGIEIPRFSGGNPAIYIEIFYAFVSKASGGSDINVRRWMLNRGNKCAPYNPSNSLTGSASSITNYYVVPEDFGAKGNGIVDDTAAVQAALNSGFEVRLPRGRTYGITDTLNITKVGTRVTGYGTLRIIDGFAESGETDKEVINVTGDRVLLKSFSINHNNYPSSGVLLASDENQVEELRFFNLTDATSGYSLSNSNSAIKVQGNYNFIRHCYFRNFSAAAPSSTPRCVTVQGGAQQTIISDCQGVEQMQGGIVVGMSNNTTIYNCNFDNLLDNGIYCVRGSHNVYITNCTISNTEEPLIIAGYNIYIDGLNLINCGQSAVGAGSIGVQCCNNVYIRNLRQTYDSYSNDAVPIFRTRTGNDADWDEINSPIIHYAYDTNDVNEFTSTNTTYTASYVNSSTFKITNVDASVYFWVGREVALYQSSTWDSGFVTGISYDGTDSYIKVDFTVLNTSIDHIGARGTGTLVFEDWHVDVVFGRSSLLESGSTFDNQPLIVHYNGYVDKWIMKNCTINGIVHAYTPTLDDLDNPTAINYYFFEMDEEGSPSLRAYINSFHVEGCRFNAVNKSDYDFDDTVTYPIIIFRFKYPTIEDQSYWIDSYIDINKMIGINTVSLSNIQGRVSNLSQDKVAIVDNYALWNATTGYLLDTNSAIYKELRGNTEPTGSGYREGDLVKHADPSDGEPAFWVYTLDSPEGFKPVGPVNGIVTTSKLSGNGFSTNPLDVTMYIEDLLDVQFESPGPQVNDVLKFDGTYWRAEPESGGTGTTITGFLTRETYVTNTNAEGSGYDLTYAGGEFRVFDGNTEVTGDSPVTYSIIGDS